MDTDSQSYEETPPIPQDTELDPNLYPPPKPSGNSFSVVTTIIILLLLVVVGFWLSGFAGKYIGTLFTKPTGEPVLPTPTPLSTAVSASPSAVTLKPTPSVWKTYQVLTGATRTGYAGISFKLPPETLATICDGSDCKSQGTYLPGGTRFTVALRGEGQVLPDYRGAVISELGGVPMVVKETALLGRTAMEYTAGFIGTTVNGYKFSQMHGYMMPITDTIAFEINHFTPNGTTRILPKMM